MNRNKKEQPSKSEEIPSPEPAQSPYLGDLTPEYIKWHQANKSPEEHLKRYENRIPFEFAHQHNIEQV